MRFFLFIISLIVANISVSAFAFNDVPADAWYGEVLTIFTEEGTLPSGDIQFRPGDRATRAEFIELLTTVALAHEGLDYRFSEPFFTDVPVDASYFWHFQNAAMKHWVRGMGDCLGSKSCFANPASSINRAEAAALLSRVYSLEEAAETPFFSDVIIGAWYELPIRAVARKCILQGDEGKSTVRPADSMNRAEMIVMISRARQSLTYGVDCGEGDFSSLGGDRLRPERRPENENLPPKMLEVPPPETPTGVPLMRFDMSAHKVKDIVLTGLTFEAEQGSLFNATKYALWVDHDHNGVVDTPLEKNQAPKGGVVAFQNFSGGGYRISTESVTFEVRAAISASPESTTLQLRITSNGIEAEELDGRALSGIRKDGICVGRCQITQQTTPAEVLTILPQGNLFVTEGQTPIRSHLLLGGATTEPILRLSFRADGEAIDITELRVTSSGSLASSIDRLELLLPSSSNPFAEATISACGSDDLLTQNPIDGSTIRTFCASLSTGKLRVPEDIRTDILIRAKMKSDLSGGVSGDPIQLWLTKQAVSADQTGSGSVKARGTSSSSRIAANDGDGSAEGELFIGTDQPGANRDIVGTLHTSILSTVSVVENGSSDPEGSAIAAGMRTIGALRFRTAINSNAQNGSNDIVLDNLLFTVSATNTTIDAASFSLYNISDNAVMQSCFAIDSSGGALAGSITGSFYVSCTGLAAAAIATDIDSDSALTLAIQGEIINPQVSSASHSFLQLSLQTFTSPHSTFGVLGSHIHYLDQDAGASEDFYWVDQSVTEVTSTGYEL
ncbi:MAG TPA: S-layer homology domain-containing protein [Candidatus Peribacterales bacterium]|nr:S-layer homology domain-containing protein [Candidatus Peribacterales bacterium]